MGSCRRMKILQVDSWRLENAWPGWCTWFVDSAAHRCWFPEAVSWFKSNGNRVDVIIKLLLLLWTSRPWTYLVFPGFSQWIFANTLWITQRLIARGTIEKTTSGKTGWRRTERRFKLSLGLILKTIFPLITKLEKIVKRVGRKLKMQRQSLHFGRQRRDICKQNMAALSATKRSRTF